MFKRKIGLFGPIGVSDLGDVAIFCETIKFLCGMPEFDEVQFVAYCVDTVAGWPTFEKLTAYKTSQLVLSNDGFSESVPLTELSAALFLGGGYLNSEWQEHLRRRLLYPMSILNNSGIPIVLSGVNIGPFSQRDKAMVDFMGIFDKITHAALRDKHSSRYIKSGISYLPDLGILAQPGELSTTDPYILVNMTKAAFMNTEFRAKILFLLNEILNDSKVRLKFVPFAVSDHIYLIKFAGLLTDYEDRIDILDNGEDYNDLVSLVSKSTYVISARLHPVVFAIRHGKSALGLITSALYQQKMQGICYVTGADVNLSDLRLCDDSELWNAYKREHKQIDPSFIEYVKKSYIKIFKEHLA